MNRPMVYGTLMLFMLFMITANPGSTGQTGREFIGWLSSGWDDTREFMGELIGDETADTNELGEVPIPTLPPADQPADPVEPQPGTTGDPQTGEGSGG